MPQDGILAPGWPTVPVDVAGTTGLLGVDTGARAHQRAEMDEASWDSIVRTEKLVESELARLSAFDRSSVSGEDQVSYDVVLFGLKNNDDTNKRYAYGGGGAGSEVPSRSTSGRGGAWRASMPSAM